MEEIITCPIPTYKKLEIPNQYEDEYNLIKQDARVLMSLCNTDEASVDVLQSDNDIKHRTCDLLQFKRERTESEILNKFLIKDLSSIISNYLDIIHITNGRHILEITNFDKFCLPLFIITRDDLHLIRDNEYSIITRKETAISIDRSRNLKHNIIKLDIDVDDSQDTDCTYNLDTNSFLVRDNFYDVSIKNVLYKSYIIRYKKIYLCGFIKN